MFNWNSQKQKVTVKLEGCLSPESDKTVICTHGNHADSCWHCEKEKNKKAEENRNDFSVDLEGQ